jgi:hypothetical protein
MIPASAVKPLLLVAAGLFFLLGTALDRFRVILNPREDVPGHLLAVVKRQYGEAGLRKANYAIGAFLLGFGIYGLLPLLGR